jgi:hypothetical protein
MRELLLPLFVQVALTFALLIMMGSSRASALRSGNLKLGQIALRQPAWPARTTQIANCFHNQLEVPILFYAVVILTIITKSYATPMVELAWAFVATRLLHAFIHVTRNNVMQRFYAFLAGVLILLAMWILLATRVLMS